MPEVTIRPYNPDGDYPSLAANLRQAELFDPDRDTKQRLQQFASSVIVAEMDGQVVGSVYVVDHIVPTLFRLVVNERYRRQGIGTALVEAAKDKLRQSGAQDVELFFAASNKELRVYYDSLGFNDGGTYRSMWSFLEPQE